MSIARYKQVEGVYSQVEAGRGVSIAKYKQVEGCL